MCINIQAVTAFHRDRFILTIALFDHAVSPTSALYCNSIKGGIWSGTLPQKAVTAYHRDRFILFIALFNPAVLPRLANLKHFQRRNLQWLSATGGVWSGTLPPA